MIKKNTMDVNVSIDTRSSQQSKPNTHSANTPFCIAVLGDFSGRDSRSQHEPETISSRRLIQIDRDNFEEVMASLEINLRLNFAGGDGIELALKELDDFHPDQLYDRLETFSNLRSLRRRLKNNNSFAEAAAELQSWNSVEESPATQVPIQTEEADVAAAVQADAENFLDSILDSQQASSNSASSEASQIQRLIKSVVAPYVEPAADPRQDAMIASVDQATQSHMRDILHHADFQALESAWQSLYFLIKRLETDNSLQIRIIDISKQELQADLAVDDVRTSAIYKLLCEQPPGAAPWSLLLGNYQFADRIEDILSLAGIATVAQQAGAPFIAGASETLVGCESFAKVPDYEDWNDSISEGVSKAWQMLRQSSVAEYIGLALPRFLLRLPYGRKGKEVESFEFEEMPETHCHDCYLWGNAAFIKAELLARNFKQNGWQMQAQDEYQTDRLPLHFYIDEGETVNKPVAEIYLTEKGGEIIATQGLIPLWSVKNSDAVRSSDYRSVAENGQPLAGRWL
jgi:type VI secretion system protein ImpC